jgi:hypothetical protein
MFVPNMFAPNMLVPGTLEPLKLAPIMFTPTFPYLPIASVPANVHPSITFMPIYLTTWPIRGNQVVAIVDKVSHNYCRQSVNI